jgi:hypothetical protein
MCPPPDHPAAVRVERAAVVRALAETATVLPGRVVRAWVAPEDRKVLLVKADRRGNTEMVAVRKGCCSKSCHWMQTATEH